MKKYLFNKLLKTLNPDEQKYMTSEIEGIADIVDYYYKANDGDEKEVIETIKEDIINSLSDEVHDDMTFETSKELKEWLDYLNLIYRLISKIEAFLEQYY